MSEATPEKVNFSLIAKGKKPELVKAAYHFGVIDEPESSDNVAMIRAKLEDIVSFRDRHLSIEIDTGVRTSAGVLGDPIVIDRAL